MDFQLILYIIIVIVWLVLDNYRRIKKKQEQTGRRHPTSQPQREVEKPYTSLEDILREFGMEEEPDTVAEQRPKPQPQPERKEKQQKQPARQAAATGYETYESTINYESSINKDYKFSSETFNREYKPAVAGDDIKKNEIKGIAETDAGKGKINFDLRKAVIWSEILKRPYA